MTISARNQLKGKVQSVREGAVSALVTLITDGGERVTATVSLDAVKDLGLQPGSPATAVVKATEVLIGLGDLKLSARNQLPGKITGVKEGAVNAVVTLVTDGGSTLHSTISLDAVKELGLKPGVAAKAVIKATSVMVGA